MFSRSEQLELIQNITLREGDRLTLDCPFCGGRKKFTISRTSNGKILWNCFKASCFAKGAYYTNRSIDSCRRALDKSPVIESPNKSKALPTIISNVEHHLEAITYLKKCNSYEAYVNKLIDIKYSPIDKRVVFYNKTYLGAIGRALYNQMPKWVSYGDTKDLFAVGTGSTAVVVEDVPSACSVSRLKEFTGIALLGTSINIQKCVQLKSFKKVIVVLDADASSKAINVSKKINNFVTSVVRMTKKDLKNLSEREIRGVVS
jgi:hypothetical protein